MEGEFRKMESRTIAVVRLVVFEKTAFDQNWHALPYRRFKIAVPHQVTDLEII